MAIRQVKSKYATKDGRTWIVDITYRDYLGRPRRYHSKKFATRREAKDHEAEYKVNIKNMTEFTDLTFHGIFSFYQLVQFSFFLRVLFYILLLVYQNL